MFPKVVVQNTGTTTLTFLKFDYYVEGGEVLTHNWNGYVHYLDTFSVQLPVDDFLFWIGSENIFHVEIYDPNGGNDEYANNNHYKTSYEMTDIYSIDETLTIECKTNNYGFQTSYSLTDAYGTVLLFKDDLEDNTIYSDEVTLEEGCYRLRIDDSGDDGLYWWHSSNQGTGYFRLKNSNGQVVENFEPEFGSFAIYEFGITDITGENETQESTIISLYPNPAKDIVHIDLNGYKGKKVITKLFSASMELLISNEIGVSDSHYNHQLDLRKLSKGIYILQIIVDDKISNHKIIKNSY